LTREWHIITCEYPPQIGGVSDHTHWLARKLQEIGDRVHVWAPALPTQQILEEPGISLHRSLGSFDAASLAQAKRELKSIESSSRQVFVQWVPHGYGRRSMNISFCRWIESLARSGEKIWLMVHEPFLELGKGSWKQRIAARVHRAMIRILLRSASRVFISIPAWEQALAPYAPPGTSFEWLPIPATIPVAADKGNVRQRFGNHLVLGHLGTYSAEVSRLLAPALLEILTRTPNCVALLIGNGSDRFAAAFAAQHPALINRVYASGALSDTALSQHLAACDLMLQPYPDGVSTRRTSFMNVLSHAVPVVSNTGHLSENFWDDSGSIVLAETEAFADACLRLLADPSSRAGLAQKGHALYLSRFDWPNVIAKLRATPDFKAGNTISQS
jgi:glycosyltransferase involved in cell wall biosynthesis